MQNAPYQLPPTALTTTTTTNIMNPPTLTGGTGTTGVNTNTFILLKRLRVVNTTTGTLQFALWKGTTGINTQAAAFAAGGIAAGGVLTNGVSISAGAQFDYPFPVLFNTADFLVGGASAAGLTIEGFGEIGILA